MITFRERDYTCTSEITLGLISGKWKPLILGFLSQRTCRFNELQKLMPNATQKMLTMQLRDLEEDGLIIRKVYPVSPPKVEYRLSEWGERLVSVLQQLCEFGESYSDYAAAEHKQGRAASRG
ncbi:transcriptional regulator [Paenibacillus sp. 598K]|uniref:winged helix-turn-helix transcriptional regulator n=1 Tax=Paenibacillus sp. 598K TaxID=1117987 RepID=UPI000FFAF82B|nr:helix-turn-helix domain-containing protein [Paenibacillus sp. 598K]GBF77959.1 transcriptional regulator [Paenibacillus sp. 598K]